MNPHFLYCASSLLHESSPTVTDEPHTYISKSPLHLEMYVVNACITLHIACTARMRNDVYLGVWSSEENYNQICICELLWSM